MALASQFAAFGTRCIPRETMNTPSYGSQRAGRPGLRKDPAPGATAFWAYRIGRTGGARRPAPPVPLSSAAPGWAGDLMLAGRRFEVTARAAGFRRLYRWLGPHFGLIVPADRKEPLVVLRLGDLLRRCAFRERALDPRPKPPAETSDRQNRGRQGNQMPPGVLCPL